jgi:hypothetical protein
MEETQQMACLCPVDPKKSRITYCLKARHNKRKCSGKDFQYRHPPSRWVCIKCAPVKHFDGDSNKMYQNLGVAHHDKSRGGEAAEEMVWGFLWRSYDADT